MHKHILALFIFTINKTKCILINNNNAPKLTTKSMLHFGCARFLRHFFLFNWLPPKISNYRPFCTILQWRKSISAELVLMVCLFIRVWFFPTENTFTNTTLNHSWLLTYWRHCCQPLRANFDDIILILPVH